MKFCRVHQDKTADGWKHFVQGCGDFSEFTWYPAELQPRFQRYRARKTIMTKREKQLPEFQRPKKWFKPTEWQKVKKMKVFGLTTSTGKQLVFEVPNGKGNFDSAKWATYLKKRVGPFLKKAFPDKRSFRLLLDGEGLLHAPEAKGAMRQLNINILEKWPAHSGELNPQEHVWATTEDDLRTLENGKESFQDWKKLVITAAKMYKSPEKLVGMMARKVRECLERKGASLNE